MSHIHTKRGQHDFTVSAYIFRVDGSPRVLFHRHKLLKRYLQIGGHVELDETPWQSLVREIKEESGYEMKQLKILQPKVRISLFSDAKLHPYPITIMTHRFNDDHYHTDINYAFVTREEPRHMIAEEESDDFKLLSRAELIKLPDSQTYLNVKEISLFIFDNILNNWDLVDCDVFPL